MKPTFNDTAIQELKEIRSKYPTARAAVLPALYVAQREFGWLNPEAIEAVANYLNIPRSQIRDSANFYFMYKNRPMGRHIIQLCTNVSCMIFGGEELVELIDKKYGVRPGGTTEDGRFSLVIMECIGACDKAPAMLVNEDSHGNLTADNIFEILERYK